MGCELDGPRLPFTLKSERYSESGRSIPSVLREALVNAIVHREYSPMFAGEAVSVDIYPNRIEVTNPGGLWGGKR